MAGFVTMAGFGLTLIVTRSLSRFDFQTP